VPAPLHPAGTAGRRILDMPMLYLIRHGRAAAGWDSDPDPGLDTLGHGQARDAAERLDTHGPLDLIVSPMRRTQETAAPLAARWGLEPRIEPRVSEIPSPLTDLRARGEWLRGVVAREWTQLDAPLLAWRQALLQALGELQRDTAVVTHFIAINAAAGAACGDDRVVHFRPDYCSVTILRSRQGTLELIELGAQGQTRVL
jgi:broad specificity phosphatase PhoE